MQNNIPNGKDINPHTKPILKPIIIVYRYPTEKSIKPIVIPSINIDFTLTLTDIHNVHYGNQKY